MTEDMTSSDLNNIEIKDKIVVKSNTNIINLFINLGLFTLFLLLGFFIVVLYANKNVSDSNPIIQNLNEINPQAAGFSLENAPQNSLTANISTISGTVKWESRIATEAAVITLPQIIKQGEKIVTGIDGNVAINISSDSAIIILPNTDLDFIQLLPGNLILKQNSGRVEYTITDNLPLTIRSFGMIAKLSSGKFKITVDAETGIVTIEDQHGDVTLAYNNKQFISKVWNITTGETLIYNDDTRRVIIE
jgi:hypothetical protein